MLQANAAELRRVKDSVTERLRITAQQLRQQVAQHTEQHAQLQTEHTQATSRCAELEDQLDSANHQRSGQLAETQTLERQTADLTQAKADLQEQLALHAEQATQLQRTCNQHVAHYEELQERFESHNAAEEDLRVQVNALDRELTLQRQQYSGRRCQELCLNTPHPHNLFTSQ